MDDQPKCGMCHNMLFTAHPVDLSANSFQKNIIRNDIPFVADFWAPWCGPCKAMAPAFEQAAAELEPTARLGKLNTDVEQEIAAQFGIQRIPTIAIFKNGREVARQSGSLGASDIVRWVQTHY
jgi:thioredoxin 2